MIIATASDKGGVGKSTIAAHLAAVLNLSAPTALLDGDDTRNVTDWDRRGREAGAGFGFDVAPASSAAKLAQSGKYKHFVIDTGQRPSGDDLKELVASCDLLVLPGVPLPLDTAGLVQTILELRRIGATNYRVLLNKVPPAPQRDGKDLRRELEEMDVPLFRAEIPQLKIFATAVGDGLLVHQAKHPNTTRAWEAYLAAGKELLA